jgi:hypothetical protein
MVSREQVMIEYGRGMQGWRPLRLDVPQKKGWRLPGQLKQGWRLPGQLKQGWRPLRLDVPREKGHNALAAMMTTSAVASLHLSTTVNVRN